MARKGGIDRGITRLKGREGWWVRIYQNGRERRFKCDTKSQAKALYGRLKADIREEKYFPEKFAPAKDITLRAWIDRCLEGSANRGKDNETRYGRFWKRLLGKRLLTELTTEELRRWQVRMNDRAHIITPKGKVKRSQAPATINRYFAFLRRVLMLAVQDGKIARNPLVGVKFFAEKQTTRFLTGPELTQLKAHLSRADWYMVAFAVETGLRQDEQFSLRWKHVDVENRIVTVPMPKEAETKHVRLSNTALAILNILDSLLRGSPWVWPHPNDLLRPLSAAYYCRTVFIPALRKAGIPAGRKIENGATWHSLRHTAASRRVMAGVPLHTVGEMLGHRDVSTTDRYAHLTPECLQDAANTGSLGDLGTVTKTVTNESSPVKV